MYCKKWLLIFCGALIVLSGNSLHSEYLLCAKNADGALAPLPDDLPQCEELCSLLLNYQFPGSACTLESVRDEQAFIQKKVSACAPGAIIVFIPTTLHQLFILWQTKEYQIADWENKNVEKCNFFYQPLNEQYWHMNQRLCNFLAERQSLMCNTHNPHEFDPKSAHTIIRLIYDTLMATLKEKLDEYDTFNITLLWNVLFERNECLYIFDRALDIDYEAYHSNAIALYHGGNAITINDAHYLALPFAHSPYEPYIHKPHCLSFGISLLAGILEDLGDEICPGANALEFMNRSQLGFALLLNKETFMSNQEGIMRIKMTSLFEQLLEGEGEFFHPRTRGWRGSFYATDNLQINFEQYTSQFTCSLDFSAYITQWHTLFNPLTIRFLKSSENPFQKHIYNADFERELLDSLSAIPSLITQKASPLDQVMHEIVTEQYNPSAPQTIFFYDDHSFREKIITPEGQQAACAFIHNSIPRYETLGVTDESILDRLGRTAKAQPFLPKLKSHVITFEARPVSEIVLASALYDIATALSQHIHTSPITCLIALTNTLVRRFNPADHHTDLLAHAVYHYSILVRLHNGELLLSEAKKLYTKFIDDLHTTAQNIQILLQRTFLLYELIHKVDPRTIPSLAEYCSAAMPLDENEIDDILGITS